MALMTWTKRWPTEPGLYLFFGDYKDRNFKPRLKLCCVHPISNGVMLTADGAFLFRSEQVGIFKKFEEPEPDWPEELTPEEAITSP